jgi:hypothetical protein
MQSIPKEEENDKKNKIRMSITTEYACSLHASVAK